MGIYRGPGGTGDATQDASSQAVITVAAKDAALAAQAAAELSATNAAVSETNAASSYTSFHNQYQGSYASAPTVRPDSSALQVGDLYFNTVSDSMKVYNGTAWLDSYATVVGVLLTANNLSDVASIPTARTNLGATTVGSNLFTLANPSAITFPRFNADNSISALDASTFRTAIGAGTSSTTGTVTSVAALTLGTSGTDLSSTVATGTTTPVITLNVPTASATNRGALSAADWTTFNNKGSGTVTSTSVVSANGFAGTVATATSTPAITLSTSVTGVIKGNGTAISAATAGTDYVAPGTATTFTALQTFTGSSSNADIKTSNILEVITVSATAATGIINYDITTQSVLYYTTNASANWTVNFRGSSGTSLNTLMATGESMSVTFMVTQGATAYYNSAVTVDGTSVTPKWQGGTAPTAGNASGIDAYTYVIIKTGSAAFTVLASLTQFK